ncbi:hypothetical protein CGRA01v4_11156 [Colletotrichum graminicola]|uniref:Uncharacterized protein n=1 Tax=Colletotrichum graminicola (strain M1.001 / M2 / FGSC 10212) TaxID=645133 RepID=E3QN57_COLGM|nr:uncharacterized protein GLRG_07439 [Colletotrichum graminicola M1.001]EFQ32295.1 hypothetical protein GLRG_07439 [Colletotrichum graminicola M1.001]WDK19869.1 hypothetical protein CGRA01v4_11156 [Colletotrichum graminicola]
MTSKRLADRSHRTTDPDDGWVNLGASEQHAATPVDVESMPERIIRITADEKDLRKFYNIKFSPTRSRRLKRFYNEELESLFKAPFDT